MIDLMQLFVVALEKISGDLYESAKGPIKEKILDIKSARRAKKIHEYYDSLNKIKTIYQPEKRVNLSEIYYPLPIEIGSDRVVLSSSDRLFENGKNILVEATAGHGKSIFMRHICITELTRGKYIPLFIQLRNLKDDEKLTDLILREFSALGFEQSERVLIYLSMHGKLLLLLDGYDEVPAVRKQSIYIEIELLMKKYQKSHLIISSRPNLGLRFSYHLECSKLSPLSKNEQVAFVKHMTDEEMCDPIVAAIKSSNFISDVATTPLLLILLLISYRAESRVPDTLVEFYDLLFPTLLYRHDDTKVGYNREVSSKIGRYRLQEIFEAFSYLALEQGAVRFTSVQFFRILNEAKEYIEADIDDIEIENIQKDIVKLTCLIVEDGHHEYSYIHRSVQEFYGASFIVNSSEADIANFYSYLLSDFLVYREWAQTVLFLSGLNETLHTRYFLNPVAGMFLDKRKMKFTKVGLKRLIGEKSFIEIDDDGAVVEVDIQDGYFRTIDRSLTKCVSEAIFRYFFDKRSQLCDVLIYCPIESYEGMHVDSNRNLMSISSFLNIQNDWGNALNQVNSFASSKLLFISSQLNATLGRIEKRTRLISKSKN